MEKGKKKKKTVKEIILGLKQMKFNILYYEKVIIIYYIYIYIYIFFFFIFFFFF